MLKKCRICKKKRKAGDYSAAGRLGQYHRGECKFCRRKIESNRSLKKRYGIDFSVKKKMYKKQKGLCGACGLPLHKNFRKAHVDHNHITGEVRELLHRACNWLVGQEESRSGLLKKISAYCEKWS